MFLESDRDKFLGSCTALVLSDAIALMTFGLSISDIQSFVGKVESGSLSQVRTITRVHSNGASQTQTKSFGQVTGISSFLLRLMNGINEQESFDIGNFKQIFIDVCKDPNVYIIGEKLNEFASDFETNKPVTPDTTSSNRYLNLIIPVILYNIHDEGKAKEDIKEILRLFCTNDTVTISCNLLAASLRSLFNTPQGALDPKEFIKSILSSVKDNEIVSECLTSLPNLIKGTDEEAAKKIWKMAVDLGTNKSPFSRNALVSVSWAIYAFLKYSNDFLKGFLSASASTGDMNNQVCLYGALWGIYNGYIELSMNHQHIRNVLKLLSENKKTILNDICLQSGSLYQLVCSRENQKMQVMGKSSPSPVASPPPIQHQPVQPSPQQQLIQQILQPQPVQQSTQQLLLLQQLQQQQLLHQLQQQQSGYPRGVNCVQFPPYQQYQQNSPPPYQQYQQNPPPLFNPILQPNFIYNDDEMLPPKKETRTHLTRKLIILNQLEYEKVDSLKKQKLTTMVTVVGPDATVEKPSVDLVAVMDISGSMSGTKIQQLREALKFVITQLGEDDRLSLITFNECARRRTPLTRMNENGKNISQKVVDTFNSDGGTSIGEGLRHGIEVLKQRRHKNEVSCIILLSDGQDGRAKQMCQNLLTNCEFPSIGCVVHTFGFGTDHDAPTLSSISEMGKGSFNYIKDFETTRESFGAVVGGLKSAFASDIKLTVQAIEPNCIIRDVFSTLPFSLKPNSVEIAISDIYEEERRDILIEIELPELQANDTQNPYLILDCSCKYNNLDIHETEESDVASLFIFREPNIPLGNPNLDIDSQKNRILTSRVIKEALDYASSGNYAKAKEVVATQIEAIKKSSSSTMPLSVAMIQELQLTQTQVSETQFRAGGQAYVLGQQAQTTKQRAANFASPSYGHFANSSSATAVQASSSTNAYLSFGSAQLATNQAQNAKAHVQMQQNQFQHQYQAQMQMQQQHKPQSLQPPQPKK